MGHYECEVQSYRKNLSFATELDKGGAVCHHDACITLLMAYLWIQLLHGTGGMAGIAIANMAGGDTETVARYVVYQKSSA